MWAKFNPSKMTVARATASSPSTSSSEPRGRAPKPRFAHVGKTTTGVETPRFSACIALACLAIAAPHCGRIFYPTTRSWTVPKAKVAITLDAELLDRVDELVARREFRNRSQAIETALAEKLMRARRTRLARECAKLNPADEKALAGEGLDGSVDAWPEY